MEEEPKSPTNTDRTVLSASANAEIGGRYRIVKWLGSGAMGAVHLAEDSKLHRQVAIKTVRAELSRSPEFCKRIERECVLHARVGPHPHIVTLFDKFEEAEQIHLVMEYIQGEPLQHVLEQNMEQRIVLPPTTSLTIAAQCLEALFRIHAHGIVHRDIKPANIMVTLDDAGETCAKLMDFGIARLMDGDEQYATLTTVQGGGPGTPLYMAPEQIDSKTFGPITYATDIYSMGILLYQLFSGHPPFMGTVTELLNAHVNLRPPPLHNEAQWSVPRALEDILSRALAKQPSERFASAQEFRQQLMQISGSLTKHPKIMTEIESAAVETTHLNSTAGRGVFALSDTLEGPARVLLPAKPQKRGMLGPVLAAVFLVAIAVVAGGAAYWVLAPRGTVPRIVVADNTPIAPADAAASQVLTETPTTVSLTPTPAGDSPAVASDAGAPPQPGAVDTATTAPAVKVSDLPESTPNISVSELGFGYPVTLPPGFDAPVTSKPATDPAPVGADKAALTGVDGSAPEVKDTPREYKVKPGDTLLKIAEANKVDFKDLQWWNSLKDPDNLVVEQTLLLYAKPGLQAKDKFFASIPAKPATTPPSKTPTVAQTPPPPLVPSEQAPPEEVKQPPKKKSIKDVFQKIFRKNPQ